MICITIIIIDIHIHINNYRSISTDHDFLFFFSMGGPRLRFVISLQNQAHDTNFSFCVD